MCRKHRKHKKPNRHIHSSDSNAEDSEYGGNGAGIYKKEHINERAFATSMRNEQRSRSFGSLVDMEPDAESATGYDGHPQNKKDILHIMEDLSIDDERIERSEVPPDFFPPPPDSRRGGGQAAASPRHGMYPPPHSNGPVPLGATGNGGRRRR